jgi:putative hydrolase of the HAD superfamily
VLFDVDDTLCDYSGACRRGLASYLSALGLPAGDAARARWQELEDVAYARYLAGELTFFGQRRQRARGMAGADLTDDEADAWFAGYRSHYEAEWVLFSDVLPALAALSGMRMGVLTNSDTAYQQRKLAQLGLGDAFHAVVGVDLAGAAKPAPEAFLAACAALGTAPEQTAHVGDRLDVDALGAQAAGLRGVWVDRAGAGAGPDGIVRVGSLAELPAALGR